MTTWVTRGGSTGEHEKEMLVLNRVGGSWLDMPNLAGIETREDLARVYAENHREVARRVAVSYTSQMWSLLHEMRTGDFVALPQKGGQNVAIGQVIGPYEYIDSASLALRHTRPVSWLNVTIAKEAFDLDLRRSFGSFATISRVRRENVDARILRVTAGDQQDIIADD